MVLEAKVLINGRKHHMKLNTPFLSFLNVKLITSRRENACPLSGHIWDHFKIENKYIYTSSLNLRSTQQPPSQRRGSQSATLCSGTKRALPPWTVS